MRAHPLAMLITAGPGGLSANLLPFLLTDDGAFGTLRAHLARNNPQVAELRASARRWWCFRGRTATSRQTGIHRNRRTAKRCRPGTM
nr:FMN-binding negative transcriptional regulator [Dickeya dadantii]